MLRRDPWQVHRPLAAPWLTPPLGSVVPPRGREHRRVTLRTEIWLGHDGIFTRTPGELRELSEGGALVDVAQRFQIGTMLHLRFQLPQQQAFINSTVAVRNYRPQEAMGVQFVDLSDEDRCRIRSFVDRFASASPY